MEGRWDEREGDAAAWRDPLVRVAVLVVVGVVLGESLPWGRVWLFAAVVATGVAVRMLWRGRARGARTWCAVAVVVLAAAWLPLRRDYVSPTDVSRYLTDEPQLAVVTGVVDGPPYLRSQERGPFGRFHWEPPATLFVLELRTIVVDGAERPAAGKVIARIDEADTRLASGQHVRMEGWLAAVQGPLNPGEFDFRAALLGRGIAGRITAPSRGNLELLGTLPPSPVDVAQRARERVAGAALASLNLGMEQRRLELGLLQTMLLGQWSAELKDLEDEFRKVGLTHILSISGAHLAILMGIVWVVVRLVVPHPPRAALIVFAVLLLYMMAVPLRVPVVRAGLMAGLFCVGGMMGRRATAAQLLSLACVICLVWRPMDLFTPGFQLSFGIVAALLAWARPVSHWLMPPPAVRLAAPSVADVALRWLVDYVAVSVVAFGVALPVVAYHFGVISPLAVLLSVLAWPVVTMVLLAGYLKIVVGVLWPSASLLLSYPAAWFATMMLALVEQAASWPGAAVELSRPPSAAWTLGATAVAVALFAGRFAARRGALACAATAIVLWCVAEQRGDASAPRAMAGGAPVVASVTMFAVGDGSCYLVQAGGRNYMFDCGSAGYFDVGSRSIAPSLRRLGVREIDVLFVSHADLDHFSGVLDVVDAMRVKRILAPPQFLAEADAEPLGAGAFLVQQLRGRAMGVEPVAAGWRAESGGASLEMLWPPPRYVAERANDTSLVLSIRVAGRRVLLSGDIADDATRELLEAGVDLRADVADLPHHGSFVRSSPEWFAAVSPTVVLQSSGPGRLRTDKWAAVLRDAGADRLVTATDGMVRVFIREDGSIHVERFRE